MHVYIANSLKCTLVCEKQKQTSLQKKIVFAEVYCGASVGMAEEAMASGVDHRNATGLAA